VHSVKDREDGKRGHSSGNDASHAPCADGNKKWLDHRQGYYMMLTLVLMATQIRFWVGPSGSVGLSCTLKIIPIRTPSIAMPMVAILSFYASSAN
jgi:hypothetical protein